MQTARLSQCVSAQNFLVSIFVRLICRKDFLCRNRIPLPVDDARYLFGIADETKSLKEGQCFIQYQTMNKKSYKVVTGNHRFSRPFENV